MHQGLDVKKKIKSDYLLTESIFPNGTLHVMRCADF